MTNYVVVREDGSYYTGNKTGAGARYSLLWTPHKKFAKRYVRRAWAEKIAVQWNAKVMEIDGKT